MIMTGIDFETTGLLDDNPRICAVGMAMYDVTPGVAGKDRCRVENTVLPLKVKSFIVDPDCPFTEGAIATHGITPEITKQWGISEKDALLEIKEWMLQSEFMVAYNGNAFDRKVLREADTRLGTALPRCTWVDPYRDIEEHPENDDLIGTCAKHGFLFDDAHSALADVVAMMRLLFMHDIARITEIASSPLIYLRAEVSYDEKDLAKARGYKWDKPGMPKAWVLETREMFKQKEIDEAPFGLDIAKEGRWELLRPKKSSHANVVEI